VSSRQPTAPHSAAYVFDVRRPPSLTTSELTRLLGGKAANLVIMATQLALPVPPAFVITTEACNQYLATGWPPGLDQQLREHLRELSRSTQRQFGGGSDPLLVSVRSGAPRSMPGMMDTILNLGLNEEVTAGLATLTGDPDFAGDCLRRFRQMYRETVGVAAPDDPWEQLRGAVQAVFRSWNGDRARAYRAREGIPDHLGTAVTVQAMVFGNRGPDSGTGVLFTRNPATGERRVYGDVMFDAQGEDVVGGTHQPEPIASLDERLPAVAAELRDYAERLERHFRDLCDIEFTIERGRLWLLQVRIGKRSPQAALRIAVEMAEDPDFPCTREEAVRRTASLLADPPRLFVPLPGAPEPLTVGLPASPGVAAGEVVTTSEAAERAAAAGRSVILVRDETSPADVRGMAHAVGILTARGGLASHAAVVARGWGIPAVVGAAAIRVDDARLRVNGRVLSAGDLLTIDGGTGRVYAGALPGSWNVAPTASTLLGWARDLGIDLPAPASDGLKTGVIPDGAITPVDDSALLRGLLISGVVSPEQLAISLGSGPSEVVSALDRMQGEGMVERANGGRRLTGQGKLRALDVFATDGEQLGAKRVAGLLEAFHPLDMRMKETVTGWQIRELGGQAVPNDHSDPAYDAEVLRRLTRLHEDTLSWMTPLRELLPRFGRYVCRLEGALDAALAGDHRYVASPRVESYHGIWFELHEDLIRLAGKRRADQDLPR
jgi:pyruvate, orthophosphate dikinase